MAVSLGMEYKTDSQHFFSRFMNFSNNEKCCWHLRLCFVSAAILSLSCGTVCVCGVVNIAFAAEVPLTPQANRFVFLMGKEPTKVAAPRPFRAQIQRKKKERKKEFFCCMNSDRTCNHRKPAKWNIRKRSTASGQLASLCGVPFNSQMLLMWQWCFHRRCPVAGHPLSTAVGSSVHRARSCSTWHSF